jgi:hypothetical protein
MNIKLVGILAACGSLMGLACGDSTSDAGGGGSGTGAGNTGGDTSTGAGNMGGAPGTGGAGGSDELACPEACEILYACGLEGDPQNCVGFTPEDEATFLPGCEEGCADNMALLTVVDSGQDDCAGLIDTISNLNADFANVCENGVGQGGGGEGGAGGAP